MSIVWIRFPLMTALVWTAAAFAKATEPPSGAAKFARIKTEYEAERKQSTKEILDPKTGKVMGYRIEGGPKAEKYLPDLLELGREADETVSAEALTLAIIAWPIDPKTEEAFDLLLKRHGASTRLNGFVREHSKHYYQGQDKRLTRIAAVAKAPEALAITLFQLAQRNDPVLSRVLDETPEKEAERRQIALGYYRQVTTEFATVDAGRWSTRANRHILQLEQLQAGRAAPPLKGKDLSGAPIQLEDLRGKVVVVDFWGSWCGPCLRKLPMMKEVAAKFADQGVVFLGVMSEMKAEDALKVVESEKVPWRNCLDLRDEKGESPIVKAWGVVAFPSVFILDQEGKIRFVRVMEREELERALVSLLPKKAESATQK